MRVLCAIVAVVIAIVATPAPVAAKSKAHVAANCLSQSQARRAYPSSYLKYRAIGRSRCWYAPGKQLARKQRQYVRVAMTGRTLPSIGHQTQPTTPNNLERVQRAMCGGPCPRFDLDNGPDRATYRALCGGPCPRFREDGTPEHFDEVFRAFGSFGR